MEAGRKPRLAPESVGRSTSRVANSHRVCKSPHPTHARLPLRTPDKEEVPGSSPGSPMGACLQSRRFRCLGARAWVSSADSWDLTIPSSSRLRTRCSPTSARARTAAAPVRLHLRVPVLASGRRVVLLVPGRPRRAALPVGARVRRAGLLPGDRLPAGDGAGRHATRPSWRRPPAPCGTASRRSAGIGRRTPIWITENGIPTGVNTDDQQARRAQAACQRHPRVLRHLQHVQHHRLPLAQPAGLDLDRTEHAGRGDVLLRRAAARRLHREALVLGLPER